MRSINITELCNSISGTFQLLGPKDVNISIPAGIHNANKNSISFSSDYSENAIKVIRNSKAGAIICHDKLVFEEDDYTDKTLVLVSNPRLAFIQIMQSFFTEGSIYGIHPTAVVDKNAEIHPDVHIGPNTCVMGKCRIGANTVIHGNVYMYPNVVVGSNVIIHAGVVIGSDGFSYEKNEKGELEKFPHIGGVIIEDNVEIGANTSIDRGTLSNTIIGKGTKIDNLCHIAHNVNIGRNCLIISQSMIGGSVTIGDASWLAPGVVIRDGIVIGKGATIGMGSVVTKNITDNSTVFGVPAK